MTAHAMPPGAYLPGDLHGAIVGDLMAYMGRRRISQRSLAATIGVDQSTVSRWFNKDMTVADLERVLTALGLSAKLSLLDAATGEVTLPYRAPYLSSVPPLRGAQPSHESRSVTQPALMRALPTPN